MVTELLDKAQREADKAKVRRHPKLAKASARLAVAVEVLLEAAGWGTEDEVRLADVWEAIEAVVPREQLRAAVSTVTGMVPPPDADDDGGRRAEMAARYTVVSGMVKMLTEVIEFGANAEGEQVLAAMKALPDVLAFRSRTHSAMVLPLRLVDASVVTGAWKRLVFGHPARTDGLVDRNAYVFCVLEQFHRHLKRREIYAPASGRWRDPNAQLLEGAAWTAVKDSVLTDLGLPADADALLAAQVRRLDATYRAVGGRLAANTDVTVDEAGKIHVASVKAIEEPPSLIDLRKRVEAMMPRVDISEAILRRGIKGIRNLQEGRHALAEKVFHGRKSQLFQRYYEGMEDQLGALGIVLNCLVLWNTVYIDEALTQLRATGYPVRDEDVARLSPFIRKHINVHGRYSFHRPELPGGHRPLRDPDAPDDEDED